MKIFEKTTSLGPERSLLLEPREPMPPRETVLTPNWKTLRVGLFLSAVGVGGDDAAGVTEQIVHFNHYDRWFIGMTNGQGYIGEAGAQFVGAQHDETFLEMTGTETRIIQYNYPSALWANGETVQTAGKNGQSTMLRCGLASAASGFCAFLGLQIVLGEGTVRIDTLNNSTLSYTNTSLTALTNALVNSGVANTGQVLTGGWWGSSVPIGLRHFFVRAPYYNNRIRIHAMQVMQLA